MKGEHSCSSKVEPSLWKCGTMVGEKLKLLVCYIEKKFQVKLFFSSVIASLSSSFLECE